MARIHSCNVLQPTHDGNRFWRFATHGGGVREANRQQLLPTEPLPARYIAKGWNTLFRTSLNIAWLPPGKVFIRVIQIPKCETDEELRTMVEFQLERISPMPLGQAVWSMEPVPNRQPLPESMQSIVVVIAARNVVEHFLGELEGRGFLADRLEVPFLHELLNTAVDYDGVWIHPFAVDDKHFALTAWWTDKTLRNISLVNLSEPKHWEAELHSTLGKVAWAGEVEGWLRTAPRFYLVSEGETLERWKPMVEQVADGPVEVVKPLSPDSLAALNAERVARGTARANLLPQEHQIRYKQQLTDRIWMRGLGAVIIVYLMFVIAYLGWLEYLKFQKNQVLTQIHAVEPTYNRVIELEARIRIQEEQISLRYAALDGWRAVSEALPSDIVLNSLSFSRGNQINLIGMAPAAMVDRITDFNEAMSRVMNQGRVVFQEVSPPSLRQINTPQGQMMEFNFSAEMSGPEIR